MDVLWMHPAPSLVVERARNMHPAVTLITHHQLRQALQLAEAEKVVLLQRHPFLHREASLAVASRDRWRLLFRSFLLPGFVRLLVGLLVLALVFTVLLTAIVLLGTIVLRSSVGVDPVSIVDLLPAVLYLFLRATDLLTDVCPGFALAFQLFELRILLIGPWRLTVLLLWLRKSAKCSTPSLVVKAWEMAFTLSPPPPPPPPSFFFP